MHRLLLLAASLLLLTLPGCKHDGDATPTCYSGVVLGDRCWDGVLIQVDSQYPLGKSLIPGFAPDSLGNTNVIAAVNSLGGMAKRGQRIYFTYEPYTNQPIVSRFCTANNIPLPIPHLVLTTISATSCSTVQVVPR